MARRKQPPADVVEDPIFQAIARQDVEEVRRLLASGADLTATDPAGLTPLQRAWRARADEIALMLIDAGAPLTGPDLNLYWAAGTGRADLVQQFIDAGADVNFTAIAGTPLRLAAKRNFADVVRVLIDAGADLDAAGHMGTALYDAVNADSTAAALLLIRSGANLTAATNDSMHTTLLTTAVAQRNRELVRALLEAGAEVDARGKVYRWEGRLNYQRDAGANATPLTLAARLGDIEMVDALLDAGADVHAKDEEGRSALDRAREAGHSAVVERLAAVAAARPARIDLGEELTYAAESGDVARARELLAQGAPVDARDARSKTPGYTPLMHAARRGDVAMAEALLDAGAAVGARDSDLDPPDAAAVGGMLMFCGGAEGDEMLESMGVQRGRTPLHLAVVRGEAQMVRLLLARGADVNAGDVVGRTPLMVAVERESEPMLRELLAAGADPNASDANKETPLKLAAGNDAIVRLLKEAGAAAPPPRRKRPPKSKRPSQRASRPKPAPPLPEPDFSAATKCPEYARAVEEMEQRCGSKRQPIKGVEGVYRYHVHSSKRIDLRALREEMLARGFYAFSTGATEDDELALAPTADKYEVIAAVGTNGANYDLGPPEVVQWLRDLEREVPFILTGIGFDFLKGHFTGPRAGPEDLARRMYEFCPDIVDQGCGTVEKLADSLAESEGLFFWWD